MSSAGKSRAYRNPSRYAYDDGPFSAPSKPLAAARLTLITSTGHFVEGVIGGLAPDAHSFVGATAQTPLINHLGRECAGVLTAAQVDAALLVPV